MTKLQFKKRKKVWTLQSFSIYKCLIHLDKTMNIYVKGDTTKRVKPSLILLEMSFSLVVIGILQW